MRARGFTSQTLKTGERVTLRGHPGRVAAERRLWLTVVVRVCDGLEILRVLRERGVKTPVLVVGALSVADPVLLRQALTNLVDNASKYSPDRTRVQVTGWTSEGRCGLDIEDEGPGIAAERRARVFDRFYRGATHAGGGSGLGPGIARWAVEAMGGQLTRRTTPSGRPLPDHPARSPGAPAGRSPRVARPAPRSSCPC